MRYTYSKQENRRSGDRERDLKANNDYARRFDPTSSATSIFRVEKERDGSAHHICSIKKKSSYTQLNVPCLVVVSVAQVHSFCCCSVSAFPLTCSLLLSKLTSSFSFFFLLSYLFLSYKASLGAAFVNALRENKKKKSFKAVNSGDTDFGHETALSTPACSRSR